MAWDDWWQVACHKMASLKGGPCVIVWGNAHIGVMAWKHLLWHLNYWPQSALYSPRVILVDRGRLINLLNGPYLLEDGHIFNPFGGLLATRRQRHGWHMARRDTFPPVFPFLAGHAGHLASLSSKALSFPDAYGLIHHYIELYSQKGLHHIYLPHWCIYVEQDALTAISCALTESGRSWLISMKRGFLNDPYLNRHISTKRPDLWLRSCDDFFAPWLSVKKGCPYRFPVSP